MGSSGLPSQTIVDQANASYDAVLTALGNKHVPEWIAVILAALMWALIFGVGLLRIIATFAIKDIGLPIALVVVKLISDIRESGSPEFSAIAAAVLGEFFGTEVDPGTIAPGQGSAAAAARANTLGSAFLDTLVNAFQGTAPISAADGAANAKRFAGYAINFGVTNSLMSILAELVSVEHLTQLHELGEEVARNVGLGRLVRQAVQPLIHAAINLPYTRSVNAQYRPHQLNAGEYLTALRAGRMQVGDVNTALGELGFPDDLIAELSAQHASRLKIHEIEAMVRWGKIDAAAGLQMLVDQGIESTVAQQMLDAVDLARADHEEQAYAAEILKLAQQRFITSDLYSSLIQRLHFSPTQQQGWLNRLGIYLDSQTKRLTLGEMLTLLEANLLTQADVDTWAQAEGYNADTAAMLDLYITSKTLSFDAAQKLKRDKAAFTEAQDKLKGKPVPPDVIHP